MIRNSLSHVTETTVATTVQQLHHHLASSSTMMMKHPSLRLRRRLIKSFSTNSSMTAASTSAARNDNGENVYSNRKILGGSLTLMATSAAAAAMMYTTTTTACESPPSSESKSTNFLNVEVWTPAVIDKEDLIDIVEEEDDDLDGYPVYTSEEVAENDGKDGKPTWMSYGGVVYDVTKFIANHPGGSEKIMMAAGSSIEPFWHTYRQHFASDLPSRLMEHMVIGRLLEKDQVLIDDQMEVIYETSEDPFEHEPVRHKALRVHSEHSMNAETPANLLTNCYLTPNSLFYIRHHHPVPFLTTDQVQSFALEIDLSAYAPKNDDDEGKKYITKYTLEDLKTKFPHTHVTATLQCSGNRRSGFNQFQRTSGTGWGQGAISTAKWTGVRLSDLLQDAGLDNAIQAEEEFGLRHVRMHALDGMSASVGIQKVMNPYGDCIIAYEMNDQLLPRDHGYPLRVVVPGYAGIRNVKWVNRIELAKEEAEGPWQRGLNYKILPPSITDANEVDIEAMPSVMEPSLFSGITNLQVGDVQPKEGPKKQKKDDNNHQPGDVVTMAVSGWAWAGGGRNIVRVDVTGDNGHSWTSAVLKEGKEQRFGKAWAWTFWKAEVPAVILRDGTVDMASKAIDNAFNVQPESSDHVWNVRGLGNNSWFRRSFRVTSPTRK